MRKKRNWGIETKNENKKNKKPFFVTFLFFLIFCLIAAVGAFYFLTKPKAGERNNVEKTPKKEQKTKESNKSSTTQTAEEKTEQTNKQLQAYYKEYGMTGLLEVIRAKEDMHNASVKNGLALENIYWDYIKAPYFDYMDQSERKFLKNVSFDTLDAFYKQIIDEKIKNYKEKKSKYARTSTDTSATIEAIEKIIRERSYIRYPVDGNIVDVLTTYKGLYKSQTGKNYISEKPIVDQAIYTKSNGNIAYGDVIRLDQKSYDAKKGKALTDFYMEVGNQTKSNQIDLSTGSNTIRFYANNGANISKQVTVEPEKSGLISIKQCVENCLIIQKVGEGDTKIRVKFNGIKEKDADDEDEEGKIYYVKIPSMKYTFNVNNKTIENDFLTTKVNAVTNVEIKAKNLSENKTYNYSDLAILTNNQDGIVELTRVEGDHYSIKALKKGTTVLKGKINGKNIELTINVQE